MRFEIVGMSSAPPMNRPMDDVDTCSVRSATAAGSSGASSLPPSAFAFPFPPSLLPALFAAPAARWVTGTDGTGVLRGRMKFCRPTFRAVARADRPLAVEVFTANKVAFHPIARRLIEKVCRVCSASRIS